MYTNVNTHALSVLLCPEGILACRQPCVCTSALLGTICIIQPSDGRNGHKPSGIHPPVLAVPHSTHMPPMHGLWGAQSWGGGRSSGAGHNTRHLCHSMIVTQHQGLLGTWSKCPGHQGTSADTGGTSLLQADGADTWESSPGYWHKSASSRFVRKWMFSKALKGSRGSQTARSASAVESSNYL